jgi:hypothetical protein
MTGGAMESEMDFNKPSHGLVTPFFPAKHGAPTEDNVPAGMDWFPWDQTIGPSGGGGHSSPNPMSPAQSDPMPSLLASTLHWGVPRARK